MSDAVSLAVVVPAYNVQDYVAEALQSLSAQTSPPDEIILIDDGSQDQTLQTLEAFRPDGRCVIVSMKNQGQGPARNLGLSMATSEYVYFFDADDLLQPDSVERIKSTLIAHDRPDVLLFSGQSFRDHSQQHAQMKLLDYTRGFSGIFADASSLLETAAQYGRFSANPNLYVSRRALWQRSQLAFNPFFYEDEALFLQLLQASARPLVVQDMPLFNRRVRDGSTMTMVPNRKHVDGGLAALKVMLEQLDEPSWSAGARRVLQAKVRMLSLRYLQQARQTGQPVAWSYVLKGAWKAPDATYWRRLMVQALGLGEGGMFRHLRRSPSR